MFTVYEGEKKAQYPYYCVDKSWDNASFFHYMDALVYLDKWLGEWSPGLDYLTKIFNINEYFVLNGTEFTIKQENI